MSIVNSKITVVLMVCLFHADLAHLVQKRSAKLRPDWRKMIGNQVYDYSINKAAENSNSSLFEGDIAGIDTDEVNATSLAHNAILDADKLWPGGVIPYTIGDGYFTSEEQNIIRSSLADFSSKTCLQFIDRTDERNFVTFVNGNDGCYSYIGRTGQQQYIHLQRGCVTYFGEVQHEVMHALGFNHEQTRMDRDDFVEIMYDNIKPGKEGNFEKYTGNTFNIPYDYNSIMHYGFNYFAQDKNLPTIVPKTEGANIGNRKTLSDSDVKKINLLYGCADSVTQEPATTPDPESETENTTPAVVRSRHHRRRQQQKTDWLKDFERYFLNMNTNFIFVQSSQDVRNANGTQNAQKAGCPADSPHKKRNDHCSNDHDCKDAGLGHVCCPYCEDKKCTNFCN
ncbi:putative Zinc metalloproteinase nas-14 [Hypsibius exemplaris]|uniref:Metalloendopeptidase n=1 Tax=Hypsibius exemplaris TaxID=2072580 RepID=A0A9X6NNU3_HYPEX|nr:putative Zinc metalloproteinase nas-14 [Hypsibius exemplaris]